eukprot:g7018.t1
MARLGDKIDSSANRALRDLEPTEALSILTDMVNAGDTIRNHSAFVMSATKRFKDQARSSGSRRTHPRGQRKWVPLRSVGRSAHYELLEA